MDLESPSSASNTKIAKVDKPQASSDRFRPGHKTWGAVAIAMILMAGVSFTLLRDPSELTSNRNPSSVEPEIDEAPLPSVVKLFSQDVFKLEGPEFEQLSLNLASTDAASQNGVSYQLVGEIPEGCRINPQSGELEWKPGIDQGGEYKLHVEALLFGQPPQSAQIRFAIAKARPLLKTYESELTANEYEPFSEEVVASRDLGTIVQYAIVGEAPEGCTIDKKLGWLRWTPSEGQGGQRYEIEVEAQSLTRPPEQSVLTINVGKAPALFGTFPERVNAEELFEVRIETAGPEVVGRMPARFELVGHAPVGCELDPITGVLRWKPGLDEGHRDYSFQVRATATGRKPELR
ncbi:MAG: hypothetical protein KDA52_25080, partial [Planctomycetaceae bacterium]|nr:hypothetical protein [Planctomycetaceae bacterium]